MKARFLCAALLLAFGSATLAPGPALAVSAACLRECDRHYPHCFTKITNGVRQRICPAAGCEFRCYEESRPGRPRL
jgi:hypothetical protein